MNTLHDLKKMSDSLPVQDLKMPVVFVGHGSPMNGIEDNEFSQRWKKIGHEIPVPKAVLCISAHWFTRGTHITAMDHPETIHDFSGFPKALFDVQYPAPGDPALAKETAALIHSADVALDHEWGLDHGTWSVVKNMYPDAKIPVLQLSMDYLRKPDYHYGLAQEIAVLRQKGVLIIGSGNMVHNLGVIDWRRPDAGYDWAVESDHKFKNYIQNENHEALIRFDQLGTAVGMSIPTPEHYLPLLYVLGLKGKKESLRFFNKKLVMGSVSMTSFIAG